MSHKMCVSSNPLFDTRSGRILQTSQWVNLRKLATVSAREWWAHLTKWEKSSLLWIYGKETNKFPTSDRLRSTTFSIWRKSSVNWRTWVLGTIRLIIVQYDSVWWFRHPHSVWHTRMIIRRLIFEKNQFTLKSLFESLFSSDDLFICQDRFVRTYLVALIQTSMWSNDSWNMNYFVNIHVGSTLAL